MKKEAKIWKRGIKALLAMLLLASMLVPTNAMANEYVTPGDGETDASERHELVLRFYSLDNSGNAVDLQTITKENVKLGITFKEADVQFPTTSYKDLTFLGWIDEKGNDVDENTIIDYSNVYGNFYPKFDKVVVPVSFIYPDINNDKKFIKDTYILPHGATYRDLSDQYMKFRAEDISKEDKFSGWEISYLRGQYGKVDMDKTIKASGEFLGLQAEFEGSNILQMDYSYFDTKGRNQYVSKLRFVGKHTKFEYIKEEIYKLPLPESFEGLRANGWQKVEETGEIKNFDSIRIQPNYENYIVRFMVDDSFRERDTNARGATAWFDETEIDTVYAVAVEPGETVSIPEIKEYTNIKWIYTLPEGDNLVINDHKTFLGYGDKVDTPVVNPDDGDNDNNGTDVPDVTLPEDEINNAVNEVKNAKKGDKVTVDMKDNVTLPVEVLESARGKDVEVVFNMGAYSWSINGLDITADTLKAINLEVKLDANAISTDVVKTLAGDRPTMQLSLTHNGEFGFKAKLQFNLGAEHKGKYGNLYYYNEKGKLVFMNAGKIDENGNVSLEFTHASDYVVVIDEKSMAEDTKKTENPIQDTASTVGGNGLVGMLILVALGGTFYLANKKVKAQAK